MYRLLRNHLHDRNFFNFYLANFCVATLLIILIYNFCYFGDDVFHRTIGFATVVSCGAEIAQIFLEELFAATFAR